MGNINILQNLINYRTVSIIGMDKNSGKTTVLNYILGEARGKITLGLTSIGFDGEDKDLVTGSDKPRIYIESGTLVATAKRCLFNGDITKEIIKATNINTPMGEVIIAKALSDGYVELGGASINAYMKAVCSDLINYGSSLVLVDGALGRKTTASPAVTEGCILAAGASLHRSIDKVVEKTKHTVRLFSMEKEEDTEIQKLTNNELSSSKVAIIYKDKSTKILKAVTSLNAAKELVENLSEEAGYVLIRGVITDKLIEDIIKSTDKYKNIIFLVEDGSKLFINEETLYKFERLGGRFKVLEGINLICVTCNPKSPFGYEFDGAVFLDKLRKNIPLPIYDVVGGE